MARFIATAPLALATILSACGGSGGGGVGFTPPPPVSPAPTPTPTPVSVPPFPNGSTPTFYSTSHASAVAKVRVEEVGGGKLRVVGVDEISALGGNGIGNLEYRGPDRYAVEFGGWGGPDWKPGDKIDSPGSFDVFRAVYSLPYFANLEIARPGRGVALTYTTFGNVVDGYYTASPVEIVYFAAGSITPQSEVPKTGSATFEGIADGLWIDGAKTFRLYGSPASLTADFGSGRVTSRLELRGHADAFGNFEAAPTTVLGTFTGTGQIFSSANYSGVYEPAAGYSGTFGGYFHGPAANEFGLSFQLKGSPGQSVIGAAVGKRQ